MPSLSPQTTPYYGGGQVAAPADVFKTSGAPSTADVHRNFGSIGIDNSNGHAWILASKSGGTATWTEIGGGALAVSQLTGDAGTANPSSGSIKIEGGTNIVTSASGAIVVVSTPATVSFTTANSATFATTPTTAKLSINGTTVSGAGTDANVSVTLAPKGTGDVSVTTGDVDLVAGDLKLSGAAQQIQMTGGAVTDFIGTATLATNGTATVLNTNIAATDRIILSRVSVNASTAIGHLVYAIDPGVSFTIGSRVASSPGSGQTADESTVAYFIVREL